MVDAWYAAEAAGTGLVPRCWDFFWTGDEHPRLATTWLLAWVSVAGPSRASFRLAQAPFVVALVLGCWLLGDRLGGRRAGAFAAWAAPALPVVLLESRKWDLQFSATGLELLGLGLLATGLGRSGRRGWGLALGGGATLALAAYAHPVVLAGSAIALAGAVLIAPLSVAAGDRLQALGRAAGAAAVAVVVALPLTGWPWSGAARAEWSLPRYLERKEHYLPISEQIGISPERPLLWLRRVWGATAETYAGELAALALPGGLALLGVGAALLPVAVWTHRRRPGALPLAACLLALVAAAFAGGTAALAQGGYATDYVHGFPIAGVLAAWALASPTAPVPRRVAEAVVGLHLAAAWLLPVGLGLVGPDPGEDPWWHTRGRFAAWSESPSGDVALTHHVPQRTGLATGGLVEVLERGEGRDPVDVVVLDLAWLPDEYGDELCLPEAWAGPGAWGWGSNDHETRRAWQLDWVAAFARRGPLRPRFANPARIEQSAFHPDPPPAWGPPPPELIAVRLWLGLPENRVQPECEDPRVAAWSLITDAAQLASGALPEWVVAHEVRDLGGAMIGLESAQTRPAAYLHAGLWMVPRGAE